MSVDSYLAPSSTSVWIGGIKIDDAFRVDWKASNAKSPLYGWADKQYRAVADGRQLVTGRLIINYRFPGYLYTAIQNSKTGISNNADIVKERAKLRENLTVLQGGTTDAKIELLLKSLQRGDLTEFHRHGALLQTMYASDTQSVENSSFSQNPSDSSITPAYRIPINRGPFDIRILYGSTHMDSYQIEKLIRGVYIVGESQVISGSATGGGDISSSGSPIYEVYNFMAKELKELVRQPEKRVEFRPVPGANPDGILNN